MPKICLVPLPLLPSQGAPLLESVDSGEVTVHEIVDEKDTFVNQFLCGDLTSQKLKAARSTLRTLIRLRSKKVRSLHPSPQKRRNVYSMKQRELITQLFDQMTGSLTERIEKINMIHGYEKIRHKTIVGWSRRDLESPWKPTTGGLIVGIEMPGEADDDILDSVVDPAPLAVEIDDSESDEDSDEDSDSDKGGRKG
jgi:hypothetical protein